ncbi:MAG TPA: hypothetical protein RMH99_19870 [Sandaracinaceae bacterium LLY-WYZ-13_1]|nr:hypothetical protein [Sandaracinaceae bacterium LLY-WYZ-13_1]
MRSTRSDWSSPCTPGSYAGRACAAETDCGGADFAHVQRPDDALAHAEDWAIPSG